MPIAALIALLPTIMDAGTQVAALIQRLQAEGRAQTTEQETAALAAVLAAVKIADANFDSAFGVKE
jgi:hypothetical protein